MQIFVPHWKHTPSLYVTGIDLTLDLAAAAAAAADVDVVVVVAAAVGFCFNAPQLYFPNIPNPVNIFHVNIICRSHIDLILFILDPKLTCRAHTIGSLIKDNQRLKQLQPIPIESSLVNFNLTLIILSL
jgi:hypothetical protein